MSAGLRSRADRGPRRAPARGADAGATLVELLVTMTLSLVVMGMFTAGTLLIYKSTNRNDAMGEAQSQLYRAYQKLDGEIRYASSINEPWSDAGIQYVEYAVTNNGVVNCTQLRVRGGRLERRTWVEGAAAATVQPPLASDVSAGAPFTRTRLGGQDQLRIRLTTRSGGAADTVSAASDVTFTALNSTGTDIDVCNLGKDVAWPAP